MLLSALLLAQALPPMALPSGAEARSIERAEVDHVLVITLAYLQMDSQPLIPLEQGSIPLAGRPGLELALEVPRGKDGSCPEQASLLVVTDRRVPSFTTQVLQDALKESCFTSTWMLVDEAPAQSPMALPKASEPRALQGTLRVVPLSDRETGLFSLDLGPEGDTLSPGLAGPSSLGSPSAGGPPPAAEPLILGRLDSVDLEQALAQQEGAIQACGRHASGPGRVLMKFTVEADGVVSTVEVETGMQAPEVEACIADSLASLQLPAGGHQVTVILPVSVSPAP